MVAEENMLRRYGMLKTWVLQYQIIRKEN